MRALAALLLALLLTAASCESTAYHGPHYMEAPPDTVLAKAVRLPLSPVHAAWWYEAEECTGLRRNIREMGLYAVPDDHGAFACGPKGVDRCLGWHDREHSRIYVAAPYYLDRTVFMHESIHALGVRGHPRHLFRPDGTFDACERGMS